MFACRRNIPVSRYYAPIVTVHSGSACPACSFRRPTYDYKFPRIRLGQPHSAQNSELMTKIAVCVICKDGPQGREQVVGNELFQSRETCTFLQIFHVEEEGSVCNSHSGTISDSSGPDLANHPIGALIYSCSLEFRVLMW